MGTTCCSPELPLDPHYNPYSSVGPGAPLIQRKTIPIPTSNTAKSNFSNNGAIENIVSKDVGIQMLMPTITVPTIQAPEMQTSGIRTQMYINTIEAAVQQQQKARALQLQMLQQQAMLQAQLQQSKRIQMQQQRQLAIQQQKEALMNQHGPAPGTATAIELPPVSPAINQRRKQLKMMKYEGQAKGIMMQPFKFTNNGFVYFGQWDNGQPHGKGLIYFPDGSVFQGGFIKGKPIGKGRLISQNGDYYQGSVQGHLASGRGISENSLVRYQGQFQNNIPHGQGIEISLDGKSRFVGIFENGNKKVGNLIWGQNRQYSYEGQFLNNLFEGTGVLKSQGGIYTGTFSGGKKHGSGRYQWHDGRVYEGQYQNDMKNGIGQLFGSDGNLSYKGSWRDDYPNGTGTAYSNGNQMSGQWDNGEFLG